MYNNAWKSGFHLVRLTMQDVPSTLRVCVCVCAVPVCECVCPVMPAGHCGCGKHLLALMVTSRTGTVVAAA